MPPYLTRNRTALQTNAQKSQLNSKTEVSTAKKKSTNNSVANKALKVTEGRKVLNTRSSTRSKNALTKKQSDITSESDNITSERKEKVTKHSRLSKDRKEEPVNIKGVVTRNSSNLSNNESKEVKRRKIRKKTNKNAANLRQLSLKESFINQSKTRLLRSRVSKNHKNDSVLKEKDRLQKTSRTKERNEPVYRCVSPETCKKNANEVYEFTFDIDDSRERLPKKRRKRRIVKNTQVRKKKTNAPRKYNKQKAEVCKEEPTNVQPKVIAEKNSVVSSLNKVSEVIQPDLPKEDSKDKASKDTSRNENTNKDTSGKENANGEGNIATKPTIVSVDNLNNTRIKFLDKSLSKSDDFMPFRPTNIFNKNLMVQQKNMLNYSLFEKSLSPITKPYENYDFGSPWRVPSLITFSQVQNMFQSTPQNKRYDIFSKKLTRAGNNEFKTYRNITALKDISQRNDKNISMEGHMTMNTPKKRSFVSSRKFGTEITNIDHSVQSNSVEDISERVVTEAESIKSSVRLSNIVNTSINNVSVFENYEDKENTILNHQSPKKVPKKGVMGKKSKSPQKSILNVRSWELKANVDPVPRPLGIRQQTILGVQGKKQKEHVDPTPVPSGIRQKIVLDVQSNKEKENVDPTPGPSGIRQKIVLGVQSNKEKENVDPTPGTSGIRQRTVLGVQSNIEKENVDPMPGPSGIRQKTVLDVRSNEQKENVDPMPGPSGIRQKTVPDIQSNKEKENVDPTPGPSGIRQRTVLDVQSNKEKENVDPAPGPSGLHKPVVLNTNRVLRQTNLNSFLNIMEVPESTAISTSHGIFDDSHSVANKPAPKRKESDIGVKNAFGFNDEDSNEEISPIKNDAIADKKKVETRNEKRFARISVGELKNRLFPKYPIESEDPPRNQEYSAKNTTKFVGPEKYSIRRKKYQIDVANFSDTFDVLSDFGETSELDISEVPLFAELEPSHFKQPPQHSYKRKRAVTYNIPEESSEEEEDFEYEAKRKKPRKRNRKDERLIDWIQETNRTFDEIEQYDLIVE